MPKRHAGAGRYVVDEAGGNVLLDMFVLDQRIGDLLRRAFRDEGVPPAHYAVYAQIGDGVTTPGEVAARLNLSPGTLTGYLDALERKAHLVRSRSESDGRSTTLTLSHAGREKWLACQAIIADTVHRLDSALGGAAGRDDLRLSLGRLDAALDEVVDEVADSGP